MFSTSPISPRRLCDSLRDEHIQLEAAFEKTLNCLHVDDSPIIQVAWAALENALREHLRDEEERMLPMFDAYDPKTAQQIRAEHARIRDILDEQAIALQLHTLREHRTREFIDLLKDHAQREEKTFYRWAQTHTNEATRREIDARIIARSLRRSELPSS